MFSKVGKYCNNSTLNFYTDKSNINILDHFSPKNRFIVPQLYLTSNQFKQKYFVDLNKEKEKLETIISDIDQKEKMKNDQNESKIKKRQSIFSQLKSKNHDSEIAEYQLSHKIMKCQSTAYLKAESRKEYTLSTELKNEISEIEMFPREKITSPKKNKYDDYKQTTANINLINENHKKRSLINRICEEII